MVRFIIIIFIHPSEDKTLRPTLITPAEEWTKVYSPSLLSRSSTALMTAENQECGKCFRCEINQREEKNRGLDLLDAMSKSGGIALEHVSLHTVIVSSHCFSKVYISRTSSNL